MACKGKQKSMAHNEGCGDHRRKYLKRKIGNGRQRKATNLCGKKGLLWKTASHRLPLTEGNGKKIGKLACHGSQRTVVAKKNNGKFTNGKSEKKVTKKNLRKTIPAATSTARPFKEHHNPTLTSGLGWRTMEWTLRTGQGKSIVIDCFFVVAYCM